MTLNYRRKSIQLYVGETLFFKQEGISSQRNNYLLFPSGVSSKQIERRSTPKWYSSMGGTLPWD